MFQINCPKCDGMIKSPLLIEVETIRCDHCKEVVTVENVFVATKNFIMHRQDLLKRFSSFKALLGAVAKEIQSMEQDDTVSEQSRKSLRKFQIFLKEMMQGARSSYRLDLHDDLYVEIKDHEQKRLAKLTNLSSTGASIELPDGHYSPDKDTEIIFKMHLPGQEEELTITGQVVWKEKLERNMTPFFSLGIHFIQMDKKAQVHIWDFIQENLSGTHSQP